MVQQGQTIELTRRGSAGERLWAYRYRLGGRRSARVQRGGFASEEEAREALERELERRERRISRSLTLAEFVDAYLAQHDVQAALNAAELDPWTLVDVRWTSQKNNGAGSTTAVPG